MTCYHCTKPVWFCRLKHAVRPVVIGLMIGITLGGSVGALLALIQNHGGF